MARLDRKTGPDLKLLQGGKKDNSNKNQKIFNMVIVILLGVLYCLVLTGR